MALKNLHNWRKASRWFGVNFIEISWANVKDQVQPGKDLVNKFIRTGRFSDEARSERLLSLPKAVKAIRELHFTYRKQSALSRRKNKELNVPQTTGRYSIMIFTGVHGCVAVQNDALFARSMFIYLVIVVSTTLLFVGHLAPFSAFMFLDCGKHS